MKRALPLFLLSLCVLTTCDSTDHEKDLEKDRQMYILLKELPGDQPTCVQEETSAFNCAIAAGVGSAGYVAALQTALGITVAAPKSQTEVCQAYSGSSAFANTSIGARISIFDCGRQYWDSSLAGGRCTGANFASLMTALAQKTDTSYAYCLNACLIQGTIFPGN